MDNHTATLLQKKIGYHFNNYGLLKNALTHSSYSNEKHFSRLTNNERLEFLGDAVLEIVTSEYLFREFPEIPEGELTKKRASIVCEQTLALCAREIELGSYLLLGKGEDLTGGRERPSVVSDAMEAVIGAIYLDGGFEAAKAYIDRFILTDIENKQLFHDSKTMLQEVIQSRHEDTLSYKVMREEGPDHNKHFVIQAFIGDKPLEAGSGSTKKAAEQEAAYRTLLRLNKEQTN